MIYGYARVSTKGQATHGNGLEEQRKLLLENGVREIYEDCFTGTKTERPELNRLMGKLQSGDCLVVTKLDRLARNVEDGIRLIKSLLNRNVKVNVLNIGVLEDTALGNFFLSVLLAVAELERNMIVERMQAGKAIARTKNGFREGRPPIPKAKKNLAVQLIESGHTYKETAEMVGISTATIIRAVREKKDREKEEKLKIN